MKIHSDEEMVAREIEVNESLMKLLYTHPNII